MYLTIPSDVELVEQKGIQQSAVEQQSVAPSLMRTLAIRLLDLRRLSSGDIGFPVNCQALSDHRRIRGITEISHMSGHVGSLVPTDGGFYIVVRKEDPTSRKRWTIAHELGHTYFFDMSTRTPVHNVSGQFDYVERLCDSFSSELLMPYWSMMKRSHEVSERLDHVSLERDASFYGVSIQAFLIRMRRLDVFRSPTHFALVFENVPNKMSGFARKPRVTTSLVAKISGLYIPTNIGADRLGLNGAIDMFRTQSETLSAQETVRLWSSRSGKFAETLVGCSAVYKLYRSNDHASVVGLFEVESTS